jgi:hypothetical protein
MTLAIPVRSIIAALEWMYTYDTYFEYPILQIHAAKNGVDILCVGAMARTDIHFPIRSAVPVH